MAVLFFGFLNALAIFCSTPDFLAERAAVFLAAVPVLFLAAGFFLTVLLAVFFTVLLGVLFFVIFRAADFPLLTEGARLAVLDLVAFFVAATFLAGLFLAVPAFEAVFFAAGLPVVLLFTVVLRFGLVLFLEAGLAFRAAVFFPVPVAAVLRFLAPLVLFRTVPPAVLFLALTLFFFAPGALVFLEVDFAAAPVAFAALLPAGDALFFEAAVLPLAAPEVFFTVVDFFPATVLELLTPLLLPEELLAFGIVISLLIQCYSISVFLLIW